MSDTTRLVGVLDDESVTSEEAHNVIDKLHELPIKSQGLTKLDLKILFKVILDPYSILRSGYKVRIVRNLLYPREPIPSDIVIDICGCFGVKTSNNAEKRLTTTLQVYLVKWLVLVYSFLEDSTIIDKLYGLFFNYLEFEYLRPHVAHLLFLSTKKTHVNQKRIDRLRGLRIKYDQSEHIIALLILYKEFAPDQVFDIFPNISHTIFSHPNYSYLQELINLRTSDDKRVLQATNDELQQVEIFGQKLKKRKKISTRIDTSSTANPIDQIHSISELVKNIDKLEIPNDIQNIIGDKQDSFIFLFASSAEKGDYTKLNVWLEFVLEDFGELSLTEKSSLIENIRWFVEKTEYLPLSLLEDFSKILRSKKTVGVDDINDHIWFFLEAIPLDHSHDLPKILQSLIDAEFFDSLESILSLLHSLTKLLSRWVLELQNASLDDTAKVVETILATCTDIKYRLPEWLLKYDSDLNLVFHALKFININKNIPKSHQNIENVVIPPNLTYILLFVNHPYVISEICGYLNFAKFFLQEAVSNDLTIKLTAVHNSYVVDLCNALWRNKAFHVPNKKNGETSFGIGSDFINSLSVKVPIFDRNSTFPSLFNISHSPAFASKTAKLLRQLEDEDPECSSRHAGPLTNGSIIELQNDPESKWLKTGYEDTKLEILKKMDKEPNYTGLADLLFSHLKSLLGKR